MILQILVFLKKYKKLIPYLLMAGLVLFSYYQYNSGKQLRSELNISAANVKAYVAENSGLKTDKQVMQLSVSQLKYFKDSITVKMDSVRKVLKVKDSQIKSLQYYKENYLKDDTIRIKDTIFVKNLKIDTTLQNKYYKLRLQLSYPSTIQTSISFTNEKYIIVEAKKETINPPNKFCVFRWFQKKHTVLKIDVVDSNPYSTVQKQRFIEIIK